MTHTKPAAECAAFALAGLLLLMAMVVPAQPEETHYSVHMREDHPDVWSSIERIGPCAVPGEPTHNVVIPWDKYYPPESRRKNETGTVVVLIIFDADSCPRSAMVTRSSGFPLLDTASLRVAILTKTTKRSKTAVDQPSLLLPITWKITGVPSR
jgi:TonB family protein